MLHVNAFGVKAFDERNNQRARSFHARQSILANPKAGGWGWSLVSGVWTYQEIQLAFWKICRHFFLITLSGSRLGLAGTYLTAWDILGLPRP